MIRTIWTLALLFSFADPGAEPHIRSQHHDLIDALEAGVSASPTLRAIVARIGTSDVIVYLVWRRSTESGVAAHVSFMGGGGPRRYLRVVIDPTFGGCQLLGLLGHELQHVAEIAEEPSVVDERTLAALYRRIGFPSGRWDQDRFESSAAIEVGRRVMREALTQGSPASRAR